MYIYKDGKYFHAEIWIKGQKYCRSTRSTNRREADTAAKRIEADLRKQIEAETEHGASLQLVDVAARYMLNVGDHHAGADNTDRLVRLILKHPKFSPTKLITEIMHDDALALRAWRRQHQTGAKSARRPISAYTVNDTIEQLKKLFTFVKASGITFGKSAPKWKELWLEETPPIPRELSPNEASGLDTAIPEVRDGYRELFEFTRFGKRKNEIVTLKWEHVKWDALPHGMIERRGKKGKVVRLDITPEVRAILWPLYQRRHENCGVPEAAEYVFTFTAERTIVDKVIKGRRYSYAKGKRYPITKDGMRREWEKLRSGVGLTGPARFRFHDHRHDLATKVLRKTGNLKLAAELLDHADIGTVSRTYAHVTRNDTAGALSDFAASRGHAVAKNPRNRPRSRTLKAV